MLHVKQQQTDLLTRQLSLPEIFCKGKVIKFRIATYLVQYNVLIRKHSPLSCHNSVFMHLFLESFKHLEFPHIIG